VIKDNLILDKTFQFSLMVIEAYKKLIKSKEFILSRQLLKAGTNIGANVNEATAAMSKKEFIAKMPIASKEARETKYWLLLLEKSNLVTIDLKELLIESDSIINILTAIIKTAQKNKLE
jgi:four helix bundle protein